MPFAKKKIGVKKQAKFWLILALVIVLVVAYFAFEEYRYNQIMHMTNSSDERIFPFTVQEGELPAQIARNLEKQGFIRSGDVFLKYTKRAKVDNKLQAGRFFLAKNLFIPEIADKLTRALAEEVKITFPEGFSLEEMDARLVRIGLTKEGEFLSCVEQDCDFSAYEFLPEDRTKLEGFFFPDTYHVIAQSFTTQELAEKMLNVFEQRVVSLMDKTERELLDTVIMASILEKETGSGEERPIVADLFWRRLDAGMPLGADATVRFFTNNRRGDITYDDLQEDNPYNTRKNAGLTPTAICNPSLEALRAVIMPEANSYWYFLHDKSGGIHYAENLEKHNLNKAKYL